MRWTRASFIAGLSWLLLAGTLLRPVVLVPQTTVTPSIPLAGEEFVGPFPSWTNLKTAYHAVGDGKADDTAALQNALDDLGQPGHSPVLFVPRGTYRITKTLTLAYRIFISVVGDDPASVTFVWDGPDGGTMLLVNGVAYSRFTRLTFDGRRKASIAVDQSWDQGKPHFDTGNEYSDHVFIDVEYGIRGGFKDAGFAETSIVRSHFVRNTKAGVALGNFNALDIWIWYSTFDDCATGVTNEPGAGNFHVYGSIFRRSTVSDLYMKNTGGFSARGNYSANSRAFFLSAGPVAHPATIELQGNTILDALDATPIRLGNQGPGLLLDNVFRSRRGAAGPVVAWRSFLDADVTSVGNTFTVPSPVSTNGRLITVDDRVVAVESLNPAAPSLPATLPDLTRAVFDVEANGDGAAIQRAIDKAAQRIGTRPVVHIPFGTHAVTRTLTVPGDLQIVGDGPLTVLRWDGESGGPVVRLTGPTKATLRELQVDGSRKADAIAIDGVDQPQARVSLDGVQVRSGVESNVRVNRLRNTAVQLSDFGHGASPGVSIKLTGSAVTIFSGASSNNGLSYEASEGANAVVRDMWYEGMAPNGFISVHGDASFTLQSSQVATPADGRFPAIRISDLNGRVAILTNGVNDRISISGNGAAANLLGLGILRGEYHDSSYFENETNPSAAVLMANTRQRTKAQGRLSPGTLAVRDVGKPDADFIRRMLEDARSHVLPAPLTGLPSGVSDVRMFRVWAVNGTNNITLKP